jgi:hypothetical protein
MDRRVLHGICWGTNAMAGIREISAVSDLLVFPEFGLDGSQCANCKYGMTRIGGDVSRLPDRVTRTMDVCPKRPLAGPSRVMTYRSVTV